MSALPVSKMKRQIIKSDKDILLEMHAELVENGNLKIVSANKWLKFGKNAIGSFLNIYNLWVAPTDELMDILDEEIGELSCIEICAGLGLISKELEIKATDSYLHASDEYETLRNTMGIAGKYMHYPNFVKKLEASEAVDKYKPECVLGCYAIPKWEEHYAQRYFAETGKQLNGSVEGVDYNYICSKIKKLILVGHKDLYCQHKFWKRPHRVITNKNIITRHTVDGLSSVYVFDF